MKFDAFISHASEDKVEVARPLAELLESSGISVWIDERELTVGDSLRREIDKGLSRSRYGIVILSPAFLAKEWPQKELDALVAREDGKHKVILPVWHNVSKDEVATHALLLADKLAVSTSKGVEYVAQQLVAAVGKSAAEAADTVVEVANEMHETIAANPKLSRVRCNDVGDYFQTISEKLIALADVIAEGRCDTVATAELRAHAELLPATIEKHLTLTDAMPLSDQLSNSLTRVCKYEPHEQDAVITQLQKAAGRFAALGVSCRVTY